MLLSVQILSMYVDMVTWKIIKKNNVYGVLEFAVFFLLYYTFMQVICTVTVGASDTERLTVAYIIIYYD